jgi:hypothetical protein
VDKALRVREVLLAHFDFPADRWVHMRTTNVIGVLSMHSTWSHLFALGRPSWMDFIIEREDQKYAA